MGMGMGDDGKEEGHSGGFFLVEREGPRYEVKDVGEFLGKLLTGRCTGLKKMPWFMASV